MTKRREGRIGNTGALMPAAGVALLLSLTVMGCGGGQNVDMNARYVAPERAATGLVVILPGIEGQSAANQNIRRGLYDSGVSYALAIYRWGFPVPGVGMFVNQTNPAQNRNAAAELARRIIEYQQKYPGQPVFLVGHSGGGGVAVFALEALATTPNAQPVEGAFLLSASISANYPLTSALNMTRRGIVNVHNPDDVGLLKVGTALFGNVDGGRGDSAGRVGFTRSYPKLFNRRITGAEVGVVGDPHFVATDAKLIAQRAPAWLGSKTWPPAGPK